MKNKLSKVLFSLLMVVYVLSTCMTVLALVQTSFVEEQDGLVATLSFDKKEYELGEKVNVSLSVKNDLDVSKNVKTEIVLPNGFQVVSGNLKQDSFALDFEEEKLNEVVLSSVENIVDDTVVDDSIVDDTTEEMPDTGIRVIVYETLMILSFCGLLVLVISKKIINRKTIASLVICLALAGTVVLTTVVKADSLAKEFIVEGTIKYNGEDVVIKGIVNYSENCTDPNCVSCPENYNKCTVCAEGYELNSEGYCEKENYTEED